MRRRPLWGLWWAVGAAAAFQLTQSQSRQKASRAARRASVEPSAVSWETRYSQLKSYREEFGNADAVLGTELGRWCKTQRRRRAENTLSAAHVAALDALGFSWRSPSDPTEEDLFEAWDLRLKELAAYRDANGNGQVPKKWRENPALGGWVAAARRRGPDGLDGARRRAIEAAGFEWISSRTCGSTFMKNFRRLRDMPAGEAPDAELVQWRDAQAKLAAKGGLSPERTDYLRSIGAL